MMLGLSRSFTGTDVGARVGLGTHPVSGGVIDIIKGHGGITRLNVPVLGITRQLQDAYNYAKVDDYGLALASALPKIIGAPIKLLCMQKMVTKQKPAKRLCWQKILIHGT